MASGSEHSNKTWSQGHSWSPNPDQLPHPFSPLVTKLQLESSMSENESIHTAGKTAKSRWLTMGEGYNDLFLSLI